MASAISATLPPLTYIPAAAGTQAKLLHSEGLSASEIGSILGLTSATVDNYLGITSNAAATGSSLTLTPEVVSAGRAAPAISVFA